MQGKTTTLGRGRGRARPGGAESRELLGRSEGEAAAPRAQSPAFPAQRTNSSLAAWECWPPGGPKCELGRLTDSIEWLICVENKSYFIFREFQRVESRALLVRSSLWNCTVTSWEWWEGLCFRLRASLVLAQVSCACVLIAYTLSAGVLK